jgi:hypothetical protein
MWLFCGFKAEQKYLLNLYITNIEKVKLECELLIGIRWKEKFEEVLIFSV